MNGTIGKRIKELRKELKMTQRELAEPEMTKGMLSHIENGTANPSMKNLHYIANKLNKPIAYFLQEETINKDDYEYQDNIPFDEVLNETSKIDELMKNNKYELGKQASKNLLDSYKFDERSKIYADIMLRMADCYIKLSEFEEGEKIIDICCRVYVDRRLYIDAAKAKIKLLKKYFDRYEYNECVGILDKAEKLYKKSTSRDAFVEILLLLKQPAILFTQGNFDRTIEVCQRAISISTENNVYYYIDDAYRLMAITYLVKGDYENFLINADKARKYGEFTENKLNLAKIYHNYAKYENEVNNPDKALEYLDLLEVNAGEKSFYYYLEYGKAKYLSGSYNEALKALSKINFEVKIPHVMDCIYLLTGKIYKGLIYSKLQNYNKAIEEIEGVIKEIEAYTKVEYEGVIKYAYRYLAFSLESLSEAYSLKGDYQKAYELLKKANELKPLSIIL